MITSTWLWRDPRHVSLTGWGTRDLDCSSPFRPTRWRSVGPSYPYFLSSPPFPPSVFCVSPLCHTTHGLFLVRPDVPPLLLSTWHYLLNRWILNLRTNGKRKLRLVNNQIHVERRSGWYKVRPRVQLEYLKRDPSLGSLGFWCNKKNPWLSPDYSDLENFRNRKIYQRICFLVAVWRVGPKRLTRRDYIWYSD